MADDDDEKRETAEQESTHQAAMRDEEIQVNDVEEQERESSPPRPQETAKEEDTPAAAETTEEVNAEPEEEVEETTKFVEWDPTGRFGRTTELLGRGTYKNVYKAFDEEEGMDVAWNQVKVHGLPSAEKARLLSEVEILKRLDHKNVLKFYHSWNTTSEKTGEVSVNFITEACAGTLNKYAARFKNNLDMRAVKSWSRQILRGLEYLHSHDPPIVHRDLKCDNIFVNGNAGEIKIGDLGLAAMLDHQRTHSVIGTPEFMAPELYEEDYDERVDIYSFGMCLMELVTFECPYNECKNPAQIYKRVSSGIPPAALEKIKEKGDDIYEFISLAIAPVEQRPSAKELLEHIWLKKKEKKTMVPRPVVEEEPEVPRPIIKEEEEEPVEATTKSNGRQIVRVDSEADATETSAHRRGQSLDVRVKGHFLEDNSLRLRLRIADSSGQNRTVEFPFITDTDSARSVAAEMVQELGLETSAIDTIEREIEKEVKYLWDEKQGFCVRDDGSRRHSAENSGGSSPESKQVRPTVDETTAKQSSLSVSERGSQDQLPLSPSLESLSERPRLAEEMFQAQAPVHHPHEDHVMIRPKSAFDALRSQYHENPNTLTRSASGGSTPGDASPTHGVATASPVRPMSVPPAPLEAVVKHLEQFDASQKPPRPVPSSTAQPHYSENVMQEVHRVFDESSGHSERSSDAGSYMNEDEEEEMEELRLLEELELQQQQEEAEMRQRHTTERQQKLRSLQKKRLERTASKMALLAQSETGSESGSAMRNVSAQPLQHATAPSTHPSATRLSNVHSASNLNPSAPAQAVQHSTSVAQAPPVPAQQQPVQAPPSMQHPAQYSHAATSVPQQQQQPYAQTAPPMQQQLAPVQSQAPVMQQAPLIQEQQNAPGQLQHQAHAQQPHVAQMHAQMQSAQQPMGAEVPALQAAQVAQLQAEHLTISRTASQRSMQSDSGVYESDVPPEEQARLVKEKKRIEALAKMQMMEETSLLSLDSKPKGNKGSMMSLSSQAKKSDSADEIDTQN